MLRIVSRLNGLGVHRDRTTQNADARWAGADRGDQGGRVDSVGPLDGR